VRLLLDTHIWLWSAGNPGKLSRAARKAIEDPSNERWISPISIWEVLLLVEKGRIKLDGSAEEWIAESRRELGLLEAPLNSEVALATRTIRLAHRDPADMFLAATALVYELTLVTGDRHLRQTRGISVL